MHEIKKSSTRTELLLAESNLNRTLLLEDVRILKTGLRDAIGPVKKIGILAASMASILGIFRGLAGGNRRHDASSSKPSFLGTVIRLVLTGWLAKRRYQR